MREHPILFSGPMVCAILGGSKTQTRRVKNIPQNALSAWFDGMSWKFQLHDCLKLVRCPFGQPGDLLWVRETWRPSLSGGFTVYRADRGTDERTKALARTHKDPTMRWHPSIHMPRCACRIVLKITNVRVERIQQISEADCWAEGIEELDGYYGNADICATAKRIGVPMDDARATYVHLWDALNSERGYGWNSNPWVWVIEFKRVEVPGE